MEQKKILWIFSILIAFLVVVFAAAWFFYSPSSRMNNTTITNLDQTDEKVPALAKVDADAWAAKQADVPSPSEATPPTVQIQNKVTVVTDSDDGISVKSLVDDEKTVEGKLPASISNEVVANISNGESETAERKESEAGKLDVEGSTTPKTTKPTIAEPKPSKKKTVPARTSATPAKKVTASKTAAKSSGTVKKPATKTAESKSSSIFWVQTASLSSRIYAEEARKRLQDKNLTAQIFTKETVSGLTHRVRVGPFANRTEAEYWLKVVRQMEDFESSFVLEEKL